MSLHQLSCVTFWENSRKKIDAFLLYFPNRIFCNKCIDNWQVVIYHLLWKKKKYLASLGLWYFHSFYSLYVLLSSSHFYVISSSKMVDVQELWITIGASHGYPFFILLCLDIWMKIKTLAVAVTNPREGLLERGLKF